jgi:glutathione S-transferase
VICECGLGVRVCGALSDKLGFGRRAVEIMTAAPISRATPFSRDSTMTLHLPALTTLVAILLYAMTLANVAFARVKYKIAAPAVTGNDDFERVFRVQMNTLEQLVAFLPALWLFALYVSPAWSSVIGAVWIVGRVLYSIGYTRAARKRARGFEVGSAALAVLWIGALWGVVAALLRG